MAEGSLDIMYHAESMEGRNSYYIGHSSRMQELCPNNNEKKK